ncbi:hypothetical protein GCM10009827_021970 [Dactylosporangium maewongense]|uniref:Secreted protein n=1 Tax=Dactylosporangium maewongense TaxID=634393 RepID=A0ABN1ZZK0_9ACTN
MVARVLWIGCGSGLLMEAGEVGAVVPGRIGEARVAVHGEHCVLGQVRPSTVAERLRPGHRDSREVRPSSGLVECLRQEVPSVFRKLWWILFD